ncbi:MAG TPA: hypothetical protein VLG49_00255 [Rhabdochlamydiaceae bacterium]|nr:hypothetical protein [Rhabdochlamydiaceae bacterium]
MSVSALAPTSFIKQIDDEIIKHMDQLPEKIKNYFFGLYYLLAKMENQIERDEWRCAEKEYISHPSIAFKASNKILKEESKNLTEQSFNILYRTNQLFQQKFYHQLGGAYVTNPNSTMPKCPSMDYYLMKK